ncbi:MAG: hypothetical protein M0C28_26315 [Candidatus Moduliflexus flocculans]|nr:hypothetical protein [Candidatus Moduliflexus flocculans]
MMALSGRRGGLRVLVPDAGRRQGRHPRDDDGWHGGTRSPTSATPSRFDEVAELESERVRASCSTARRGSSTCRASCPRLDEIARAAARPRLRPGQGRGQVQPGRAGRPGRSSACSTSPSVSRVEKGERFIAAKLLAETVLASGAVAAATVPAGRRHSPRDVRGHRGDDGRRTGRCWPARADAGSPATDGGSRPP